MKLLHPFMPFVTEEIWQRLPGTEGSIMSASFPAPADFPEDDDALRDMALLMGVITGIRNIRGEMNLPPSKKVKVVIDTANTEDAERLRKNADHIITLGKVEELDMGVALPKPEASATSVFEKSSIHVILKGLIDFEEEKKRIRKSIAKIEKDLKASEKKLSNPGFLDKAPENIVAEVKAKAEALSAKRDKLEQNLSVLEKIDE